MLQRTGKKSLIKHSQSVDKQSSSKNLFTPYPKQQEYIDAVFSGNYNFLCYGGAMGGGKSYVGIAILIALCKFHPMSKWVVVRESLPTLKRTSIETFKKIVPSNFLKSYNQQAQIATFNNGSQIEFMAEDYSSDKDFDRFKGLEVNGFLLEQIEELQKGLLDMCFIRSGRHKIPSNPKPIIMANVNPTQGWAKEKIYEAWIKKALPIDWYYIPASIFDNPILADDKAYMEQFKNLDPITYRRLIEGDWDAFAVENPFAYCFSYQKHVKPCKYMPEYELMLSFDFNVDPITCLAAQQVGNSLHMIKAFQLSNSNIYDLCDRIISEYGHLNPLYLITGDATGRARSAMTVGNMNYYRVILKKLGLVEGQMKVPSVNPAVSDTRVLLNSMLQNFDIKIDEENCKALIQDLQLVQVDAHGDIMKDRSSESKKADLLDCSRYLVNTFFRWFIKSLE